MVNKEKYLYWLQSEEPNLTKEVVWREMYSRIGCIFHVIQMVEYNIANILSIEEFEKETKKAFDVEDVKRIKTNVDNKYSELSTFTFGQLANEIKKSKYLKDVNMKVLGEFVDYRNYLAHNCFKEKLLNNELVELDQVDAFINELSRYESMAVTFNEWLLEIFKNNRIKTILLKV